MNLRGTDDKSLMIVTASVDDARAFILGELDENAFLQRIDGWVDSSTLLQAQMSGGQ